MVEQKASNRQLYEKIERRRGELGLAPLEIKEREPTPLEILFQKWYPTGEALLSPALEEVKQEEEEPLQ
ncbi:UNVERIFIED_CONTAM: hypothetical protein FKN15_071691 [Acipenser sinensis]